MEIKKLRKDNHKLVIGGLIAFCLIAVTITYLGTRAKYQNTEIIPLVNGVVNYKAYDFKVMAMYQQKDGSTCTEDSCYNAITTMPESGYTINESKSYCTVDNKNHSNAVLKTIDGNHTFSKISKSDKCYIWFDKQLTASEQILANATIKSGTPTFRNAATTDEGIYKTADPMYGSSAESYYYRGAVTNNYVKFGNYCWRIIRINGDGSIRMIYDGTSCHANGINTADSIGKTSIRYATSDGQNNKSYYVGWTYGTGQRTLSGTLSNVKIQIESWYNNESEFTDAQKNQITDGKFCNDRNTQNNEAWRATGSTQYYAGYKRLCTDYVPTLSCNSGDIYTLKAGLITADEVEFAGGKNENNKQYYLYNGQSYWIMSPSLWNDYAFVFRVDSNGFLDAYSNVSDMYGLRPVINLKARTTFSSGSGTISNPFIVS